MDTNNWIIPGADKGIVPEEVKDYLAKSLYAFALNKKSVRDTMGKIYILVLIPVELSTCLEEEFMGNFAEFVSKKWDNIQEQSLILYIGKVTACTYFKVK